MKLSEIRKKLDILEEEWIRVGEHPADQEILGCYYDGAWEYRPRIPYPELPASLQKAVRERLDVEKLKTFLQEMFPSQEEVDYLIQNLLVLNNPYTCPHGRPTAIKFNKDEMGAIGDVSV